MDTMTAEQQQRRQLEAKAIETCSPELYYDLLNELDNCSVEELEYIISCKGDYWKETEGNPTYADPDTEY